MLCGERITIKKGVENMRPIDPSINELELRVYAENQPEYVPLPSRVDSDGTVVTCWKLTLRERLTILFRGTFFLTLLTFNRPLQPILCSINRPKFRHEDEKDQEKDHGLAKYTIMLLLLVTMGAGCSYIANLYVNHIQSYPDPGPSCLGVGCAGDDSPDQRWLKACPKDATCKLPYWGPPRDVTNSVADYAQSEWHCGEGWWYAPGIGMSDTWVKNSKKPIVCVKR